MKKDYLSTSNPVGPSIVNQHILWWKILLVWVINTWNSIESILGIEKSTNQFLQNSMSNPIAKFPNIYNITLPFHKLLYQYFPSIHVLWHTVAQNFQQSSNLRDQQLFSFILLLGIEKLVKSVSATTVTITSWCFPFWLWLRSWMSWKIPT